MITWDGHLEIAGAPDKQPIYDFARKANPRFELSTLFSKRKSLRFPLRKLPVTFAVSSGFFH